MRVRMLAILASSLFAIAACGNDDTVKVRGGSGDTTSTIDEHAAEHDANGDHGDTTDSTEMDHSDPDHEMQNDPAEHDDAVGHGEPTALANPLPLLPDGTIDPAGVDLSGVENVNAEQQKYAEDLLVRSIKILPKWADYDVAIADGFQSIGDGQFTGEEHVLHWDWINDEVWLDPNQPESLVYKYETVNGKIVRTLEAAMYILPQKFTLKNAPTDGGGLMQYHHHDNLCFTDSPAPKVAGLTTADGTCAAPLVKFNPNIQIHVWIRQNDCGPFAALQGVGGGQIKGDEVLCIQDHTKLGL